MSTLMMTSATLSSSSTTNGLRQARKSLTGRLNTSRSSSGGGAASGTANSSSAVVAVNSIEMASQEDPLLTAVKQHLAEAARNQERLSRVEEENARLKQALQEKETQMLLCEQQRADMVLLLEGKDHEIADKALQIVNLTATNSQATEQHARQVELLESQAAMHKEAHDQMALAKAALEAINTQLSLEVQALDDQVTACIKSTIGRKYEPGTWADSSDDDPDMDRVAFDIERELHKKEVTALREHVAELCSQLQMGPQHSAYQQGRPQAPRGPFGGQSVKAESSSNLASGNNRAAARRSDDCASSDRLPPQYGRGHNNNSSSSHHANSNSHNNNNNSSNNNNTSGHRRSSSNADSFGGRASSGQHNHDSRRSSSSSPGASCYEPRVRAASGPWRRG